MGLSKKMSGYDPKEIHRSMNDIIKANPSIDPTTVASGMNYLITPSDTKNSGEMFKSTIIDFTSYYARSYYNAKMAISRSKTFSKSNYTLLASNREFGLFKNNTLGLTQILNDEGVVIKQLGFNPYSVIPIFTKDILFVSNNSNLLLYNTEGAVLSTGQKVVNSILIPYEDERYVIFCCTDGTNNYSSLYDKTLKKLIASLNSSLTYTNLLEAYARGK